MSYEKMQAKLVQLALSPNNMLSNKLCAALKFTFAKSRENLASVQHIDLKVLDGKEMQLQLSNIQKSSMFLKAF